MIGRALLWPLQWAMWALLRFLLAQRYWVKVIGKPEVFKKPGPYLILPNHPAFVDPPLIFVHLWPAFQMGVTGRPLSRYAEVFSHERWNRQELKALLAPTVSLPRFRSGDLRTDFAWKSRAVGE